MNTCVGRISHRHYSVHCIFCCVHRNQSFGKLNKGKKNSFYEEVAYFKLKTISAILICKTKLLLLL